MGVKAVKIRCILVKYKDRYKLRRGMGRINKGEKKLMDFSSESRRY